MDRKTIQDTKGKDHNGKGKKDTDHKERREDNRGDRAADRREDKRESRKGKESDDRISGRKGKKPSHMVIIVSDTLSKPDMYAIPKNKMKEGQYKTLVTMHNTTYIVHTEGDNTQFSIKGEREITREEVEILFLLTQEWDDYVVPDEAPPFKSKVQIFRIEILDDDDIPLDENGE